MKVNTEFDRIHGDRLSHPGHNRIQRNGRSGRPAFSSQKSRVFESRDASHPPFIK